MYSSNDAVHQKDLDCQLALILVPFESKYVYNQSWFELLKICENSLFMFLKYRVSKTVNTWPIWTKANEALIDELRIFVKWIVGRKKSFST